MNQGLKFIVKNPSIAQRACEVIRGLPHDVPHEVTIKQHRETRTSEQNRRLWAMLSDVSRQVCWHGQYLTPENWKDMATAALKRQQVVPGIEGGFVVLGTSTSRMKVAEMSELIEFLFAFGAENGVVWSDPTSPKEFA